MEKKKFYNQLWFAWVCMFIFPLQPLAIYLFIKNKYHHKILRYGICILFGLVFIQVLSGNLYEVKEVGVVQESEEQPQESLESMAPLEEIEKEENTQEEVQETSQPEQEVAEESVSGASEIYFIDTGNSDAILIINEGKAMIIDGGDNDDESFLVDYLKNQRITELEYVIATHSHSDHVGALDAVVSSFDVKTVFVANGDADTKTYRDFINAAIHKGLSPSVPLEDKQFALGSGYFTVMNTNGGSDANNQSLVVEYVNGQDKMLFMGDAETEVENEILAQVSEVDLLKVGHHGSRTSTSKAFLDKVNPTYAVITCGKDNKYGHPHQETMSKLEGIEVHRTDECGSIIFKSTGSSIVTDCGSASLSAGKKEESTSDSSSTYSGTTSNSGNTSSSVIASGNNTPNSDVGTSSVTQPSQSNSSQTVYWTPNGKSYHTTSNCSTLSRSKVIHSGTISESGKLDPCDKCH